MKQVYITKNGEKRIYCYEKEMNNDAEVKRNILINYIHDNISNLKPITKNIDRVKFIQDNLKSNFSYSTSMIVKYINEIPELRVSKILKKEKLTLRLTKQDQICELIRFIEYNKGEIEKFKTIYEKTDYINNQLNTNFSIKIIDNYLDISNLYFNIYNDLYSINSSQIN